MFHVFSGCSGPNTQPILELSGNSAAGRVTFDPGDSDSGRDPRQRGDETRAWAEGWVGMGGGLVHWGPGGLCDFSGD